MRILELEIENVRGIQQLRLKPNGRPFVIWGPNGSGKSAVVDAIDFLLTGQIQRLTGRGTGGITLAKHGPHIDHKARETRVRALVQLKNNANPIELKRSMAEPTLLDGSLEATEELNRIIPLAKQGCHILTSRLLKNGLF